MHFRSLVFPKVVSVFIFIFTSTGVSAQKFNIGPMAGGNITRIEGSGFENGFKLGYHAGAFVSLGFDKKWGLNAEVLWSQLSSDTAQGFQSIYTNALSQDFQNPRLEYLTIPISVYYKPSKLLSFQAGLQYGILMNHGKNLRQNGEDAFSKGDVSGLFGVQLHILSFRIYGRYVMGIGDISTANLNDEWKTSVIQLGVAFGFF
jgi:hypothetical protein